MLACPPSVQWLREDEDFTGQSGTLVGWIDLAMTVDGLTVNP